MKKISISLLVKMLRKAWEQEFCHLHEDARQIIMDSWIKEKYGIRVITDDLMSVKKFIIEDEQKYLIFMLKYAA